MASQPPQHLSEAGRGPVGVRRIPFLKAISILYPIGYKIGYYLPPQSPLKMCCMRCVLKRVISTRTEEAQHGTCLTPLGQLQKLVGFGASREHAGLLQGAGAGNQQRVWMLATEMGKGVSLSPSVECTFPKACVGPQTHKSKLLGCCPLRGHSEAFL